MRPLWAVVLAGLLTVLLVPLVRRLALAQGWVVPPGARHAHTQPTPTAGGLAVFVAVWLTLLLALWPWSSVVWGIFLGSLLLFALCLTDDIVGLPIIPRLVGQVLVALFAWQYGVKVIGITHPLGTPADGYLALGWLSAPLTVLWIVFLINAVNWLDGLDGLAGGVIGIASATLAIMSFLSGFAEVGMMAAVLAAGCLGFLFYNFHPAKIFMGDSGAMFLGYMIACLSVLGAFKSTALMAMVAPVLVLGVPIYDTFATVWGRLRRRQPIYAADRSHLHHRLLDRGLSVRQAVLVIYALTGGLCLVALGLWWR